MDDCSTDGTVKILEKEDIKFVRLSTLEVVSRQRKGTDFTKYLG